MASAALLPQEQQPKVNDGSIAPKEGPAGNGQARNPGSPGQQGQIDFAKLGPNYENLEDVYPEVVAAIRQMVVDFRYEGIVGRRHEIRRIKRNRLYWQGLQYLTGYDWNEQEWQMPFGTQVGLSFNQDTEDEAGPRFTYVTNFYLAFGLSFVAVFSQEAPAVNWYPQDANNAEDIAAAKAASDAAALIAENNKVERLLRRAGRILYVDGKLGAYVRNVADGQQFGFHQNPIVEAQPRKFGEDAYVCPNCGAENPPNAVAGATMNGGAGFCQNCGQPLNESHFVEAPEIPVPVVTGYERVPNAQEVITFVGGLEMNTPVWADTREEMPYWQWQMEVHEALLRAAFPGKAKKIQAGNFNDADDVYARASRVAVKQGLPTTHPGDALYSLITFDRNWIRPWCFDSEKVSERVRPLLHQLFPDGCYCAFAGQTYCESRNENGDDHWRFMNAMEGDGQNRPAIGDPVVDVQDRYNETSNIHMECIEYGSPPTFADPGTLDFDSLSSKDAQPGSYTPARAKPGQPLANSFHQLAPASLPPDWIQYAQELSGPIAEFLTGLFPSIWGGEMPDQKTASGYAMARDQAMGRLGLFWREFKTFWAEVMQLAVQCFRENRSADAQRTVLGQDGEAEAKVISIADLRGNIQARAEADETFPQLKSQQRGVIQTLMGFATEAPEIAESLAEPGNMRVLHGVLGIKDLDIPGEDAANKQLREIQQLLQGAPQQVMAPGPPGPDGMPTQVPQLVSSIPVDALLDDHADEFKEGKRWASSPEGMKARMENPAGFANVRAHLEQHQKAMQQGGQAKPPSESINYKDLTPGGKVQMAAQAGIQENPVEIAGKEVQDKADKAAELRARLGAKKQAA